MNNFLIDLGPEDLVVTPNQRLTNTLQDWLADYYVAQKVFSYTAPQLLSYAHFIRVLWQAYFFITPKQLLSSDEEAWLWQKIIRQCRRGHALLNVAHTALLAQTAWHNLKEWRLSVEALHAHTGNENTDMFKHWATLFIALCQKKNLIDTASALEVCSENQKFLHALRFKKIYFYHFIELTPLQQHLQTALQQCGIEVVTLSPAVRNTHLSRQEFATASEEVSAMAFWAYQHYQSNKKKKIACVVPNLHLQREHIVREFKAIFKTTTPPIDISAGRAMIEFPIIQHSLLVFALLQPSVDYSIFSTFLRSVYFQNDEENFYLSDILDAACATVCAKTTSLSQLQAVVSALPKKFNTENMLQKLGLLLSFQPCTQSLIQQRQAWLHLLQQLGWPGQRNLQSMEYQVMQRLLALLEEITGYSYLQKKWHWQEFSAWLIAQCQTTIFQPQSEKTSIQVLGLLEACGMTFDAMWIMHLEDKTWPTASSPNPFLPYAWQKKKLMPNASPNREYAYCKKVLQQLIQSSPLVMLSHPNYAGDKPLNPSPLIEHIKKEEQSRPTIQKIAPSAAMIIETIQDTCAPPVTEAEEIYGGTRIVQYQAQCPFKAFAALRLGAKRLRQPRDTPDALARGEAIHRVLEKFWKLLRTSEKLLALSAKDLEQHIEHALLASAPIKGSPENFLSTLEKIRLRKMVRAWVEVEKKRPAFQIIALEDHRTYVYKSITLKVRIDRIDQAQTGCAILLDYKTSRMNLYDWFGARLKEPQLPLYCLTYTDLDIQGIGFAQLRWNDFCFKGVSAEDHDHPPLLTFEALPVALRATHWQAQLALWKNNIHQLLDDFLAGDAAVNPRDTATCTQCDLGALCRIFENG